MKIAATMPERYNCVAGADPQPARVGIMRAISNNPEFQGFSSADELLEQPKLADVMVIGTQDNYHFEPAKKALEKGYHLLLEKPAAQSIEEVQELAALAKKHDRVIILCFVLRYTTFYKKLQKIVSSGALGDIISIKATEGVEPFHQAHSFVRGHWGKSADSTPMIIAKCSHDTDVIAWLMNDRCKSVSSFGNLSYFNEANKPEGATARCTDGCPHIGKCAYDSHRYLSDKDRWLDMVFPDPENRTKQEVLQWLSHSPWGRCVYQCDNDVVDHQVVNMEFEKGTTASLTMTAFDLGRNIEIYGTKASLRGGDVVKDLHGCDIVVREHHTNDITKTTLAPADSKGYHGHGGGDYGLINEIDHIIAGRADQSTLIQNAIEGHLIGFSAEKSRLQNGQPIQVH